MQRTVTITYVEGDGTTEGELKVNIVPPVETLSDLASVLLMSTKAHAEIVNSIVTALDIINDVEADRVLKAQKSRG